MTQINPAINKAKPKLDNFIQNDLFLNAYDRVAEAERIKEAELSFAVDQCIQKKNYEFVDTLLKENVPIEKIAKYTKLSLEEVTEIIENLDK